MHVVREIPRRGEGRGRERERGEGNVWVVRGGEGRGGEGRGGEGCENKPAMGWAQRVMVAPFLWKYDKTGILPLLKRRNK